MKVKIIFALLFLCLWQGTWAQRIDFNNYGRKESEGLEPGYQAWTFPRSISAEKDFATAGGDTIHIVLSAVEGLAGNGIRTNYWKQGVANLGYKLVGDEAAAIFIPDLTNPNDCEDVTGGSCGLQLQVSGLSAGRHSLLAYHNCTDGYTTPMPTLDVIVDGKTVATGIRQTVRATKPAESGFSYITFNATEGQPVTIQYVSKPVEGETYPSTNVILNAIVFDEPNPLTAATDPLPANMDWHVDADSTNEVRLAWKGSALAVRHHLMLGTSPGQLTEVMASTDTTYTLKRVNNLTYYYWRVDEETADGTVYKGDEWAFRPRHLAFPGAEGYGRFANGGRGGMVYHVTNLLDDNNPGSFRYGIENLSEPRTIVFDVSGYIPLRGKLTASGQFITVAGQTAPGKGICFGGAAMGFGSDQIVRFIRNRVGSGETSDGMGFRGAREAIMDHCSISWSIDEGFSSREAGNITLQRTMIAEALNHAHHNKYEGDPAHGFAAVFGGDIGSFHHNLMADNSGRNPRLDGGMDGAGYYMGRLDIFNNVVYNWMAHPAYGESHEANFFNNFYKAGPATTKMWILRADVNQRGSNRGTESYYYMGNVLVRSNNQVVFDGTKHGNGKSTNVDGGMWQLVNTMPVDWDVWVDKPFFPHYAKVETAREAYKSVLSDVGCTQPVFDDHDKRMIRETLTGKGTYKGSVTGKYGIIDTEEDVGGLEVYPEETRAASYDTDQDGMPDWWEKLKGTDPNKADNNGDDDQDGYTNLEDYLNWMAETHLMLLSEQKDTLNLRELFAGYEKAPVYSFTTSGQVELALVSDSLLTIAVPSGRVGLQSATLSVVDGDGSTYSRQLNMAVLGDAATGISRQSAQDAVLVKVEVYQLDGKKVATLSPSSITTLRNLRLPGIASGTYIIKATDTSGHQHSAKVLKY